MFSYLRNQKYDIVLLQECHSTTEVENEWRKDWGEGEISFCHGSSNSLGVCTLFRHSENFDFKNIKNEILVKGRLLFTKLDINEKVHVIGNVYGPNDDNPNFLQTCFEKMENVYYNDIKDIYVGGDFNCISDPEMDKSGGSLVYNKPKSLALLNSFLSKSDFTDVFRIQHPNSKRFTWRRKRPIIQERLDFFLIPFSLCQHTISGIEPGYKSDHSCVTLKISMNSNPRGPGFWKLNTSLLTDQAYITMINETIAEKSAEFAQLEPALKWEMLKMSIREKSIIFASNKKKERMREENELRASLTRLLKEIDSDPSDELLNEKERIDNRLQEIYEYKIRGSIIRTRSQYNVEGEKPTKYFFNLEKHHNNNKTISKLKDEEGNTLSNEKEILAEEHKFYSKLYEKRRNLDGMDEYLENLNIPSLNENEKQSCEGLITLAEAASAVKLMKNNKAPGSDGLPIEFYKMFWLRIGNYYIDSINAAFVAGDMSVSQKLGLITLLPKKDKDPLLLKNWRPLSLMNADYKIMTKSIAMRIQKVIKKLISNDQFGFMKGRYIGENIRLAADLIDFTIEENIPGLIFNIDFKKAFDSISHEFMYKCLKRFGFGDGLINWVKLTHKNAKARVVNNGWTTDEIDLGRGARQGCPLSPYLFLLCVEILGIVSREDDDIVGFNIEGEEIKMGQYADDLFYLLNGTENSVKACISVLKKFGKVSGLEINTEKCALIPIGSMRNLENNPFNIREGVEWKTGYFEVLGIILDSKGRNITDLNIAKVQESMDATIERWKKRNLTLLGKITVLKSLILSKLVYPLSIIKIPNDEFIDELERKLLAFVWDDKKPKISSNILVQPAQKGGLNYPKLKYFILAQKFTWINRLMDHTNKAKWKLFHQRKMRKRFGFSSFNTLFSCNLNYKDACSMLEDNYLGDLVRAWSLVNYKVCEQDDIDCILSQSVWLNSGILAQGKPLLNPQLASKGLIKVSDIFDEQGILLGIEDLLIKFQYNNFIRGLQVINSIPKEWINYIRNFNNYDMVVQDNFAPKLLNSKSAYTILINKYINCTFDNLNESWKRKIKEEMLNIDWDLIFNVTSKISLLSKIKSFIFRFLHGILYSDLRLFLSKVSNTTLCTFCSKDIGDFIHNYWQCNILQTFFAEVMEWYNSSLNVNMQLDIRIYLLGSYTRERRLDMFTEHFYWVIKWYVHCCRQAQKIPTLNHFKNFFSQIQNDEKFYALKYDKLDLHNKKWLVHGRQLNLDENI